MAQQYLDDFQAWLTANPAHDVQVSRLIPQEIGVMVADAYFESDPADAVYRLHDPSTGLAAQVVGREAALQEIASVRDRLFNLLYAPVLQDAEKSQTQGGADPSNFRLKNAG
jgi:hypothetical protein